jgi:PDZ domain-containing protein
MNLSQFRKVVVALAVFTLIALVPVPFVRLSPGPLFNTIGEARGAELIKISGVTTYPTSGQLNMTTVSETGGPYGQLILFDAVAAWFNPTQTVIPTSQQYPNLVDSEQIKAESRRMFSSSQANAIAAALNYLRIPTVTVVRVDSVVVGAPADGKVEPGDLVLAVNQKSVETSEQVVEFVQAEYAGAEIVLTIKRLDEIFDVSIISEESQVKPGAASVGVSIGPNVEPPFDIEFGLEDVGGPSAGLMFTLGIIDELTEKELTHGLKISGTGTININGQVGPVGGILQKIAAAEKADSDLFLLPEINCNNFETDSFGEMPVVAINTVEEAVNAIETFATTNSLTGLNTCKK